MTAFKTGVLLGLCAVSLTTLEPARAGELPHPDHIVLVILENKSFGAIVGNRDAPYLNHLVRIGALFTNSHAVAHPSEPNYLALFSGSTHDLADDSCPHLYQDANLSTRLAAAGKTFAIYSEGLPETGFTGCVAQRYARKHNPVVNWQGMNVTASQNRPFSDFPTKYWDLPNVSFVVPDVINDMHDGPSATSIPVGDRWLREHLAAYERWARVHNSLLVVTFDEDDWSDNNHIPTIIAGAGVRHGRYHEAISHYDLLRTITDMFGLKPLGASEQARAIDGPWLVVRSQ